MSLDIFSPGDKLREKHPKEVLFYWKKLIFSGKFIPQTAKISHPTPVDNTSNTCRNAKT